MKLWKQTIMGYEAGKIYKLVCEDGKYYIGSTIRPLKSRLSSHRNASTKTETNNAYNHIKTIGWDKVTIELIEPFPCENRTKLLERETWFITQHKEDELCLNTRNPLTDDTTPEAKQAHKETCRQYYQQHREEILQKRSEYQAENREKRSEYNREYRQKNAEKLKNYDKEYAEKYRERRREVTRIRRAKQKNQTSSVPVS
jgi:group I intron endonuclease